ncbi:ABC transporter substrate-binding protein [Orbaceae bacterium ESL0727]|nr:ABC transporter substrate-binding protein [Orbaceae bacterium ESL0727]
MAILKIYARWQAAIAISLAGLLTFSAYADTKTDHQADQTPQYGGTLVVHYAGEQRVLNPALRASTGIYEVAGKIVESLVDLDADGNIVPVLATSWVAEPDGKTITFKLREGVKWHDGQPFTASDVQYSALEFWKKRLNFSTALQLNLDAVDTPDDHTAVFHYSRPMPLDLLLRALVDLGYVVPRHLYEGTDVLNNPYNLAPVGTGPFKFVDYKRGQYIIAERNPDYWRQGYPYLDKIVWRIIDDKSSASAALESGQIDMSLYSKLSLADIDRFKQNPRFEVRSKGTEGNVFNNTLEFNFRNPIIADKRVRQAIVQSLDIPFFIDNFLYGFGQPATGLIPSSSKAFYPSNSHIVYPFDRKAANQLLDEAGYPRKAGGNRFDLKLVHMNNGEDVPLFSTFIQQSLAEIGINVTIVNLDTAGALNAVYKQHDFDIATGWHQYRGDPAVSTTVWLRSGSPDGAPWTNQYGWQSDTVDTLIDNAATEIDPDKRKALYAQLVDIVNDQLPLYFATERDFISVINAKKVHNHHNTARWPSSSWFDVWVEK